MQPWPLNYFQALAGSTVTVAMWNNSMGDVRSFLDYSVSRLIGQGDVYIRRMNRG